jgi:hypothetical protein
VSAGSKTVTLTVTDNDGFTASTSIHVTVANRSATVALVASTPTGRINFSTTITPTITDPDGAVASYSWSYPNGVTGPAATAGPVTASVTYPSGTGDTFVSATYPITLKVFDSGGVQLGAGTVNLVATGAPAPGNFHKSSSRCVTNIIICWERGITFAWNAVGNVNLYQIQLGSSTYTFSGTSGEITGLSGSSGNYDAKIRARDTTTGKWGAWSSTITVSS